MNENVSKPDVRRSQSVSISSILFSTSSHDFAERILTLQFYTKLFVLIYLMWEFPIIIIANPDLDSFEELVVMLKNIARESDERFFQMDVKPLISSLLIK
jgi:hypothetical protein